MESISSNCSEKSKENNTVTQHLSKALSGGFPHDKLNTSKSSRLSRESNQPINLEALEVEEIARISRNLSKQSSLAEPGRKFALSARTPNRWKSLLESASEGIFEIEPELNNIQAKNKALANKVKKGSSANDGGKRKEEGIKNENDSEDTTVNDLDKVVTLRSLLHRRKNLNIPTYHPELKPAVIAEGQECMWIEDEMSAVFSEIERVPKNLTQPAVTTSPKKQKRFHFRNKKEIIIAPKLSPLPIYRKKRVKKTIVKKTVVLLPQKSHGGETLLETNRIQEVALNMTKARNLLNKALVFKGAHELEDSEHMAKIAFAHAVAARRLMTTDDDLPDLEKTLSYLTEKGEEAAYQHIKIVFSKSLDTPDSNKNWRGWWNESNGFASKAQQYLESILPDNVNENDETIMSPDIFSLSAMSTLGFNNTFELSTVSSSHDPTNSNSALDLYSLSSLNEILDGPSDEESDSESDLSSRTPPSIVDIPAKQHKVKKRLPDEKGALNLVTLFGFPRATGSLNKNNQTNFGAIQQEFTSVKKFLNNVFGQGEREVKENKVVISENNKVNINISNSQPSATMKAEKNKDVQSIQDETSETKSKPHLSMQQIRRQRSHESVLDTNRSKPPLLRSASVNEESDDKSQRKLRKLELAEQGMKKENEKKYDKRLIKADDGETNPGENKANLNNNDESVEENASDRKLGANYSLKENFQVSPSVSQNRYNELGPLPLVPSKSIDSELNEKENIDKYLTMEFKMIEQKNEKNQSKSNDSEKCNKINEREQLWLTSLRKSIGHYRKELTKLNRDWDENVNSKTKSRQSKGDWDKGVVLGIKSPESKNQNTGNIIVESRKQQNCMLPNLDENQKDRHPNKYNNDKRKSITLQCSTEVLEKTNCDKNSNKMTKISGLRSQTDNQVKQRELRHINSMDEIKNLEPLPAGFQLVLNEGNDEKVFLSSEQSLKFVTSPTKRKAAVNLGENNQSPLHSMESSVHYTGSILAELSVKKEGENSMKESQDGQSTIATDEKSRSDDISSKAKKNREASPKHEIKTGNYQNTRKAGRNFFAGIFGSRGKSNIIENSMTTEVLNGAMDKGSEKAEEANLNAEEAMSISNITSHELKMSEPSWEEIEKAISDGQMKAIEANQNAEEAPAENNHDSSMMSTLSVDVPPKLETEKTKLAAIENRYGLYSKKEEKMQMMEQPSPLTLTSNHFGVQNNTSRDTFRPSKTHSVESLSKYYMPELNNSSQEKECDRFVEQSDSKHRSMCISSKHTSDKTSKYYLPNISKSSSYNDAPGKTEPKEVRQKNDPPDIGDSRHGNTAPTPRFQGLKKSIDRSEHHNDTKYDQLAITQRLYGEATFSNVNAIPQRSTIKSGGKLEKTSDLHAGQRLIL